MEILKGTTSGTIVIRAASNCLGKNWVGELSGKRKTQLAEDRWKQPMDDRIISIETDKWERRRKDSSRWFELDERGLQARKGITFSLIGIKIMR